MPRVMISYRNIDGQREFAAKLEKDLSNAGLDTWLAPKSIPGGSKWEDEIFKGVINSDYVVLCLSPDYFESEYCLFECYIARGYGKILLPIVVPYEREESVFSFINTKEETRGVDQLHVINFNPNRSLGVKEDYTTLLQRLVKSITNPTSIDATYDVYFSYRQTQVEFATQVADDLNRAGIKSFIHTRALDVGVDWRRASWNATLKAKLHIVILSPDVAASQYIRNEVLIMRTKPDARFLPIIAQEFISDKNSVDNIQKSFKDSTNLSILSEIQWITPNPDYQVFIDSLIRDVRAMLAQKDA